MTAWSNVIWNVDPDPLSVTEPAEPELLLELPHAAATNANVQTAAAARSARRRESDAIKTCPFQPYGIGVHTKNDA
jgi:hypothetical protein